MANGLGIPAASSEIVVYDLVGALSSSVSLLLGDCAVRCSQWDLDSGNLKSGDLLVQGATTLHFGKFKAEISIFADNIESSFVYAGQSFTSKWFSMDVSGFRTPLGYTVIAALAMILSEQCSGLIEDPARVWVAGEFSTQQDFFNQIKLENSMFDGSNNEGLEERARMFYLNLNGVAKPDSAL